jgi:hypothetical protein
MRKRKVSPADEKPVEKKKIEPTKFQTRARNKNLERAREVNAKKKREKEIAKLDEKLGDLSETIDDAVDTQVKKQLGKLDRKKLKDQILQVFHDMGGTRAMKKWAKDNPGKYYTLMANILKTDSDKELGGGGGVTVTFDFGLPPKTIDITPDKS